METLAAGVGLAALLRDRIAELESACGGLENAPTAQRPSPDAWSIREHLSHLQGDDRATFLDGIRAVLVEDVDELDVALGITHYTIDRAEIAFGKLLGAVCAQYRAIADAAERMTAEQLEHRTRIEILKDSPFGNTPRMSEWLGAIVKMHLPGHIAQIRETRAAIGA